jgi:prepilin-type N-terminal cleavage/methylation domain-containing protein
MKTKAGFTLIELSVVLVIIGLIVGSVLVGRDLISAAEVRAEISQIEKYRAAVNTFRLKFGYLPGDIPDPTASAFGFMYGSSRGAPGNGDGNGVLQGCNNPGSADGIGVEQGCGETAMFWEDLSTARLIDGSFSTATLTFPGADVTGAALNLYLPQARMGQGNYIVVYSGITPSGNDGINYYCLSAVTAISADNPYSPDLRANPGITVSQAYSIDVKMDDGLPETGSVTAKMTNGDGVVWAPDQIEDPGYDFPNPTPQPSQSWSCFDNGNVNGATLQYSLAQNANAVNCALSFRFQ